MERSEAIAVVESKIAELRKVAHNDDYIKTGIDAWDNGCLNLALAIFEDQNYHNVAESIYNVLFRSW